jgi:hypothetical protein
MPKKSTKSSTPCPIATQLSLENPLNTSELLRKIIACLKEPGLREMPPELFLFYYAGHTIQVNSKVYLVPRMANLDNRSMYNVDCLTLDKLLETLRDTLDLPVRNKMHHPRSISFLVVLDCCRNIIDDYDTRSPLSWSPDVQPISNPWCLCFHHGLNLRVSPRLRIRVKASL